MDKAMTNPTPDGTGSAEIDALMLEYTCCVHADAKAGQYDNSQAEALLVLRAAITAVVKDAERYRWLKSDSTPYEKWYDVVHGGTVMFDRAIDAAISAGKRGDGDGK